MATDTNTLTKRPATIFGEDDVESVGKKTKMATVTDGRQSESNEFTSWQKSNQISNESGSQTTTENVQCNTVPTDGEGHVHNEAVGKTESSYMIKYLNMIGVHCKHMSAESKSPALYLPFEKTINVNACESDIVIAVDMVIMQDQILVIITKNDSVKVIGLEKESELRDKIHLKSLKCVSKLDDTTAVVFSSDLKQVHMVAILSELKVKDTVKLKGRYLLVKAVDFRTLVGIKLITNFDSKIDLLNVEGKILKTLNPKILSRCSLQRPSFLCVTSDKNVVISDELMKAVFVIDLYGKSGCIYDGLSVDYHFDDTTRCRLNMLCPNYVTTPYPITSVDGLACDADGNIYIADSQRTTVVMITSKGEFMKNIHLEPTWGRQNRHYYTLCADGSGHLYVQKLQPNTSEIRVLSI